MSYIADDGDRGVESRGYSGPETIRSDWKKAMGVELGGLKAGKIIFSLFISITLVILAYGLITADLALILGGILFPAFFMVLLVTMLIKPERELLNYRAVEEITFKEDGMTVKTAAGVSLSVRYSEIGLIVDLNAFIDEYGRITYLLPSSVIVYYDFDLGRCLDLWVDKDAGRRIIMEYRKYIERTGLPLCPFVTGNKYTTEDLHRPIERLRQSAFCRRWHG